MTFTRDRTEVGRFRTRCDRCQTTQASWSARLLSSWQRAHRCTPGATA